MSKIRVKSIGTKLLVATDNSSAIFYLKSEVEWVAVNGDIILLNNGTSVLREKTGNFIEPKEDSVIDLIILLNTLTNS